MRRWAWIATVVFGVVLMVAAAGTWIMVASTLSNQRITVAEDADCLAGSRVRGPLSAYCQARVIEKHTLEITDGLTYAELDREDPRRQTAMNSSFLQASLFTSVLAFGVAGLAALAGLLFVLIGLGMKDVAEKSGELERASSG
ncbi:MAG TPA: aromatic ring-opening dioxygenase LigA [Acidimicrobiia bacterium]